MKVKEFDLTYLSISPGTYYVCKDSTNVYRDIDNKRERIAVTRISTELNRMYNTNPVNGKLYYVWETNELWIFSSNKWELLIGNTRTSSGYYYTNGYTLEGTEDNSVIDNNGLLKDGSVVVRDDNRIIKGKLYIDRTNNNLVISSFLGGGFRILPNGSSESPGSLLINPNTIVSLRDIETGEVISGPYRDIVDKYIDEELDKLVTNEINKRESSGIKLTDDEKETIREEIENRPLIRQEIMQNKYEYVTEQVVDGYALYNGQFNVTDEVYVYKNENIGINGYHTKKYKFLHEGDLSNLGKIIDIDDGDIDYEDS